MSLSELWKLVRETRSVHLDGIHCERTPPFSPTLHSKKSDPVDFIKLNNHGIILHVHGLFDLDIV